jgi:ADP-ribose pyrophosphatase
MTDASQWEASRDASVIVARDANGLVAVLTAAFPQHGGEYAFLPGGRRESGESPEECARRELREEAGVTALSWRSLGSYAITLNSTARIHLFLAEGLTLGPQQLTPSEEDFKLMWWPMPEAIQAAIDGRFLLQGGPLALLLAQEATSLRGER